MEDQNIQAPEIKSNVEKLELYSDQYPFTLPLRIKGFESEAEMKKFIKNCEKLVRTSLDYKAWRQYIVDTLGVTKCAFTEEDMNDSVSIHIHHHIPTLYMIIKAIINKYIDRDEEFSIFDICLDIIELHFLNKIGYLSVLDAIHSRIHAGNLEVPIEFVMGNYMAFLNEYSKYLDEDDLDTINIRMSKKSKDMSQYKWSKDNYPGLNKLAENK